MGVVDKLNQIKSCKEDIKQAIIDKGVDMTDVAFTEYATKISEIQAGGGDYLDIRANMSTYYSTTKMVGNCAFAYCTSLQSIDLPNCLSIGNYVFQSCTSLQSVNLPICMSVGSYAFTDCSSLLSIDLPNCSLVGNSAFVSCKSLISVNLPNCSLVGNNVFNYCSSLSVLDLRSTYSCILSNSNAFSKTPFASGVGSIYVHAAHLSQFQNATNWTYFSNCLVGVGDPNKPLLAFDNGRVYGDTVRIYSKYLSYLGITSNSVISVDLPNVKELFIYTFQNCYDLQSVNLPNCVSVGNYAFYSCTSLVSIDLPNCSYVGSSAFYSCTSLVSIDLPNCVSVGNSAFAYCSALQSVNLPMCENIGVGAFQKCTSLASITVGTAISKVCAMATGVFSFCKNLTSIIVPMSLVDVYKTAKYWSDYASKIFGI